MPKASVHEFTRYKYGARCDPLCDPVTGRVIRPLDDFLIEARMVKKFDESYHPPGWLGKAEHFRRMVTCIFAGPQAKNPFEWNPNASRIVDEYYRHKFLSIAGHASSSKTETTALLAVGEFIIDPENTGILVTSTTLAEARGRIWGRIEYYWQELCEFLGGEQNAPGELVSSSGIIRLRMGNRKDDTRGIKLVPGRESEVKEGIGRMKGFKAPKLRLLGDEFSDLSHKLLDAARSNLFVNDDFKMAVAFNPGSHFDPAGVMSEPKNGWSSIDVFASDGWETKMGYCIRFDGEKSPNVLAGRKIWNGLLTADKLNEAKANLGDNTTRFIEQYRGAWSLTGHADGIYSEAEVIKYRGMEKVQVWEATPVIIGGFDPSFTHGGDRAVLTIGKSGRASIDSKFIPCAEVVATIYLDDNIDTKQDKKELIVARLKQACIQHGLDPRNLAMDATGGGDVLATLMARDPFFGNQFMRVQFGGKASDLPFQGRKCSDRFANMASELWYMGKPMLRAGQLRGLTPDIVREITLRLYTEQSGGKKLIKIEAKEDMKARLAGRSPDAGDSFFLMLHAARARASLKVIETVAKTAVKTPQPLDNMFAWGQKKKLSLQEGGFQPAGGGWGDDEYPGSGVNLHGF